MLYDRFYWHSSFFFFFLTGKGTHAGSQTALQTMEDIPRMPILKCKQFHDLKSVLHVKHILSVAIHIGLKQELLITFCHISIHGVIMLN